MHGRSLLFSFSLFHSGYRVEYLGVGAHLSARVMAATVERGSRAPDWGSSPALQCTMDTWLASAARCREASSLVAPTAQQRRPIDRSNPLTSWGWDLSVAVDAEGLRVEDATMKTRAHRRLRSLVTATCIAWLSACTVTDKTASDKVTTGHGGELGDEPAEAGRAAGVGGVGLDSGGAPNAGRAAAAAGESTSPVAGNGGGAWGESSGGAVAGNSNGPGGAGSNAGGAMAQGGTSTLAGATSQIAGGTSSRGGTAAAAGGTGGTSGGATGVMAAELVGVWQQTRATSGDYISSNGSTFSMTSGFSVQLKLSSNGAYYLANFASGTNPTCASVTHYEQSVGQATLVGNTLVFSPTSHALDVTDCSGQTRTNLGTAPFTLGIELKEDRHFYGGIRTYRMLASGGPHPYDLMLVHRPPLANPAVPAQPTDFTLGTDGPYQEFQGLWVAAAGTDSDFFDPTTGNFHFPVLNGSPHAWLRMVPGGYETAIALQNVNSDGPCKSDVIYYEQGEARFAVLEDVGGQGNHFVGHVLLQSAAARMIVRIRECDESSGTVAYDLPGLPRYFRFIYFSPNAPPERISFPCDFAQSEWQSILCEAFPGGFVRR